MNLLNFSGLNNDPKLIAFSATVKWAEGTFPHPSTVCNGYDVIVNGMGGKVEIFSDFSEHPFAHRPAKKINNAGLHSTASGCYQILYRWWKPYAKMLNLTNFDNVSQDKYFIQILKEQKALGLIADGDIQSAFKRVSNIWASLPGAGYGQQERKMDGLLNIYDKASEVDLLKEFKPEETDVSFVPSKDQVKRISDLIEVYQVNLKSAIEMVRNNG